MSPKRLIEDLWRVEQRYNHIAERTERVINSIPMMYDACSLCDNSKKIDTGCQECCWYYSSKFSMKRSKDVENEMIKSRINNKGVKK